MVPTEPPMTFGECVFEVGSVACDEIRRVTAYRCEAYDRLGRLPARQYLGCGEETIELSGESARARPNAHRPASAFGRAVDWRLAAERAGLRWRQTKDA